MNIALISYNTFAPGVANGEHLGSNNGSVLLLQNTTGSTWGTSQSGQSRAGYYAETAAIVDPLWAQLQLELSTLDRVVLYVGSHGAERVIELAAQYGLTPDRAVFVFCDCNWSRKMELLRSSGFGSSKVVDCACGGHSMMGWLFEQAIATGNLPV